MHPVMSELGIYLAEHEGWARQEAARRDRLVRELIAQGNGRGVVSRFVHAVRQFVDPRGYAMAELRPHGAASAPVVTSPLAAAPVTRLEVLEPAPNDREPLKAA